MSSALIQLQYQSTTMSWRLRPIGRYISGCSLAIQLSVTPFWLPARSFSEGLSMCMSLATFLDSLARSVSEWLSTSVTAFPSLRCQKLQRSFEYLSASVTAFPSLSGQELQWSFEHWVLLSLLHLASSARNLQWPFEHSARSTSWSVSELVYFRYQLTVVIIGYMQ